MFLRHKRIAWDYWISSFAIDPTSVSTFPRLPGGDPTGAPTGEAGVVPLISMGCTPPSCPKLGVGDSGSTQDISPLGTE